MKNFNFRRYTISLFVIFSLALTFLTGCSLQGPEELDWSKVEWAVYENPELGISMKYPDVYKVREDERQGILFKYKGKLHMAIRYVNEKQGKRDGLWFNHPVSGHTELGFRDGSLYIYDYFTGPFFTRTLAYVVEHDDRYLGLEFRTRKGVLDLDDVQSEILYSFKFTR